MAPFSNKIPVNYIARDRLNSILDEILNVKVDMRKSDQGFSDMTRFTMGPRDGTELCGALPGGIASVKDLFFFTDDDGNRAGYISKGGEVYKCDFHHQGRLIGRYDSDAERAAELVTAQDYTYFIVNQTVYQFQGGVITALAYTWSGEYKNQADLYADFPTPDNNLFAYLIDSNSCLYSVGGRWLSMDEQYTFSAISLGNTASAPAFFNVVRLPKTQSATDTSVAATVVERVKPSGSLTSPEQYVGSYLLITSGDYKGKYGYINNFSAGEFLIVSLGNALPIISGTTYEIFATKGNFLQMTNGVDNDKYYDGSAFNATYAGSVKTHLSLFTTFPNSGGPGRMLSYGNQVYTTIGDTIYVSDVAQPLFFNITDVGDLQTGNLITDMDIWRNRFIVGGSNFQTIYNANVQSGVDRTIDLKGTYGIIPGSYTKVLTSSSDDFWFLTTGGEIISLSENAYGSIVSKNNIGTAVQRYLKTMKLRVTSAFDGRRFFIYGENNNGAGYTCVFDILYNFWSVYTGIRPAKFVFENGGMYYIEYGTGDLHRFVPGKVTDGDIRIAQSISSKSIDLGDPFMTKVCKSGHGFFENNDQAMVFSISNFINGKSFTFSERRVINQTTSSGDKVVGFNNVEETDIVAQFLDFQFKFDRGNIWKWKLENDGNNGFYLNQFALEFEVSASDFKPTDI